MRTGISTACYYPEVTERALERVSASGAPVTELFFNAFQEFTGPYLQSLQRQASRMGVRFVSVHPFTAGFETMFFFSNYPRRFDDGLEMYRRFFALTAGIGADFFILHGAHAAAKISNQEYFERYLALRRAALQEGIDLLQENVSRCKSGQLSFIREMKEVLGNEVSFVLDIKQAVRAGSDPFDFVDAMGSRLLHLHASDHGPGGDCLPPGRGTFDFRRLSGILRNTEYSGDVILELYQESYGNLSELEKSYKYLSEILCDFPDIPKDSTFDDMC